MREREGGELVREEAMEGGREGGRDGERRDGDGEQENQQNNYLLRGFDICRTHPASEKKRKMKNAWLQHPIKFGRGPA